MRAVNIRPAALSDAKEAIAYCADKHDWKPGMDYLAAMKQELDRSTYSWAFDLDGKVICLMGIYSDTLLSDRGYIWFMETDLIEENKFIFIRRSRMMFDQLKQHFTCLYGFVRTDNERSQKWLYWLGFKIGPKVKDNPMMRHFWMGER